MDFLAGEGSNLDEIVAEQVGWDIDFFCLAKRGDDKIMNIYEKIQKMTKQLTFLNMIAAKIMNNYEKLIKITKNNKKWQKHWHFWIWLQRNKWKIIKNTKKYKTP